MSLNANWKKNFWSFDRSMFSRRFIQRSSTFRALPSFRWFSESNVPKGFEKFFKKQLPKTPGGTNSPGGGNVPPPVNPQGGPWQAIAAGAVGYLV